MVCNGPTAVFRGAALLRVAALGMVFSAEVQRAVMFVGHLLVNCWQTVGQQSAERSCFSQLPNHLIAFFSSNIDNIEANVQRFI